MGRVIKVDSLKPNREYEKSMTHRFGVTDDTVAAEKITMTRGSIGPGKRTRAHYHVNAELAMFVLSGRVRCIFGMPGVETHEEIAEANSFIYVPRGEVHIFENLSQTESAEWIAAYGGVPSGEATGKFAVEPPLKS